MIKKTKKTLACIIALTSFSAFQFSATSQEAHHCNANNYMNELRASDPSLASQMDSSALALEEWTEYYAEHIYSPGERSAPYVIPVVVHILHTNGPENISDEEVIQSIARLNDDYNKLNASWSTVHPSFLGIVADCQITFKLARKNNSGACTNGITRTFSETTSTGNGNDQKNAAHDAQGSWPGNKYLNLFVVANAGDGIAGYTNYPSGNTDMSNGIVIRYDYINSGVLSHEIGHWLNLMHCWGNSNEPDSPDNCSDDDQVTDTPNTIGWTVCNVNGISCGTLDNVENYMEYAGCRKMFTEGQKIRMHAALESGIGGRDNVWSPSNLLATGVSLPDALCHVLFSADRTEICVGESITFEDQSYNYVSSTNWTFSGGLPASSSSASPTITYNTPGVYTVSLQASDGSSTITNTKTNYIVVLNSPGEALPYHEGFETLSSFPDNSHFILLDEDSDEAWEITSNSSYSGDKCVWLNNFETTQTGTLDAFMSGPIDLSNVDPLDPIVFNFRYAYRKISTENNEWLRFYISKDCGQTWVLRKNIHGSSLSSINATSSYSPPDQEAWYPMVSVTNINSDYYVSNFRFKFEFESDGGNNIFIDNINLYPESMTSLVEQNSFSGFNVYPNPVSDVLQISFFVTAGDDYSIKIFNALGELIETVYNGPLQQGQSQFKFSAAVLPKGVYFIQLENNGTNEVQKFIKN